MGKERLVIDTNILISALGWNGKPRQLFKQIIDQRYELFISIKQIEELRRVLDYPRLNFSQSQKTRFLRILEETAAIIDTRLNLNVADDSKDNMLIECAVESNAGYIISGDDDLKRIRSYRGIKIISVSEFLKEQADSSDILKLSEKSLKEVWDNKEDDIWNVYLKKK